jgi:hypothetical protein
VPVFIAGAVRKWRGAVIGHDLANVCERVQQSRDYLFAQRGEKVSVLG